MSFFQVLRRQPTTLRLRCALRSYATNAPDATIPPTAKPVKKTPATTIPVSSCPADTIMPGINYLKGQAAIVALADDAYPEWLWGVLKERVYEDDGPGGLKERKDRRKLRQQAIKDRNFMQTQ